MFIKSLTFIQEKKEILNIEDIILDRTDTMKYFLFRETDFAKNVEIVARTVP